MLLADFITADPDPMSIASPRRRELPAELNNQLASGYQLLQNERFAEAMTQAEALAQRYPLSEHALEFASEAALATGQPARALEWIRSATDASGGNPELKVKTARLLLQLRQRDAARRLALEVGAITSTDPRLIWQAGSICAATQQFADAIGLYETALAALGAPPGLLYDLAVAQFFAGRFDDAELNLDRLVQRTPQAGHGLYLRSTLRRQTPDRNHIEDLERRAAAGFPNALAEAATLYALSKELEDLGDETRSFEVLVRAAATRRRSFDYSVSPEIEAMQALRSAYTRDFMATEHAAHQESGAIFIVGMPRTGTTLLERMLVGSGAVHSAGELLDFSNLLTKAIADAMTANRSLTPAEASQRIDFAELGRDYMQGARTAADDRPLFIDKMPVNFMYCGMIRKALPHARIINLVRDPLDTCYAVFKTLFFDAYPFSYDQKELGAYYVAYHQMMQHWHEVMPGVILDVHYEDLVNDPEGQARRVLQWCGLPWSDRVLDVPDDSVAFATASAAQVREPVHRRSLLRSRQHRDGLATLIETLTAAGVAVP